jgi:uncharacterized membrane protein YeaQ/YmgE (transglycosylase-associated protein family)
LAFVCTDEIGAWYSTKEERMIWTLLVGLVVGAVAKFVMPGRDPGGIFVTMLLGVAGSFVAGWLGIAAGLYVEGEPIGFIAAVIGAVILLFAYRLITKKSF